MITIMIMLFLFSIALVLFSKKMAKRLNELDEIYLALAIACNETTDKDILAVQRFLHRLRTNAPSINF